MTDFAATASNLFQLGNKIVHLYTHRVLDAQNAYVSSTLAAAAGTMTALPAGNPFGAWTAYATDACQRRVLFWDTLRQRGNNFLEHERAGKPPLLVFDYETILDGRKLERPVNYALVRITPPSGVAVDETKRPFIIVDPRAGHGPGIGGFKQDSQVGVALKAGHPVYFVIFFPRPEPGQTLPDVCEAEAQFVRPSRTDIRTAPSRPSWATARAAGRRCCWPHRTRMSPGPVVINGAPMSYWSGSWQGGEGENPMRYLGGLMGGSWVALLTSDLGNGLVDGAHFVANFERLNPANTLWSKYYHLFANVDTEPPRFLAFERWWGGYSLMNEAELRWILDNLFVGNRLARGEAQGGAAQLLRPQGRPLAHRRLLVGGRQHHAAAAGPQLDRRRLRQHRRDQGQRPGDRRAVPRGRRAPGDLRVGPGGEEGARPDRGGAEVHRVAAPRSLSDGDSARQKGRTARSSMKSRSRSVGSKTSAGSTGSSAATRSRSRWWPRFRP